ncbi:MAG: hypothetical protein ACOC90_00075 [Bacteroidota bacterium]
MIACLVAAFFASFSHASPRMNYPGTRARAMGTAFTAIADDASAIWYNPAGIVSEGKRTDFILEFNEAIDDRLDTKTTPFIALKTAGGNWEFAFSYFNPYLFGSSVVDIEETGGVASWNEGAVVDKLDIFSVGAARLLPHRIKVGGTVEFVRVNEKGEESTYDSQGFSGSLGVQWVPIENLPRGFKVRLGGAYRFESTVDKSFGEYSKPESWNCGAAVMKSITPLQSNIIISTQYENTSFPDLKSELEYDMMSYGLEWQIALEGAISRMALRAGIYTETPEGIESDFEMNGVTYGLGLRFGESWGLEYSMEKRKWEDPQIRDEEEFTLHAIALTYSHSSE